MKRYDAIIIGAGPAGLSAAITAAKAGMDVVILDENDRPGGQLFKQIHKFFGSKEHRAKERGFNIGYDLLKEAKDLGVNVALNATVTGIYGNKEVDAMIGEDVVRLKGDALIVATGAAENMVSFSGWTLPGVIGAGAAQTMMNLHGVQPGERVLMLGSGNVGLVVGYQLLQAGVELVGVVDALPRIGGYGVHAAKIARTGVDFFLKHTIQKVWGDGKVEHVTIVEVDKTFAAIPGTEKTFDVDTICMAVGLSPMSQLLGMAGCEMTDERTKGGIVPKVDAKLQTTIPGIYAAGDVSGIEEASAAMIEGRIAGAGAALSLGYINETDYEKFVSGNEEALNSLRRGLFSPKSKGDISITKTEEGIDLSLSLFEKGYMTESELTKFAAKGFANETGLRKLEDGIFPVIECTQNIPCNPCQDACPKGCIKVGADIVALPAINEAVPCVGCGMCVSSCSGQAIFLVERGVTRGIEHGFSYITMPYEFRPLPKEGDEGIALDRSGKPVCSTIVVKVKDVKAMDKTALLTIKVPTKYESAVRFWEEDSASKLKSA